MARKRKNGKQDATQTARIVVEYNSEKGTTVRVDKAYSPQHATWLLAQAIQIMMENPIQEDKDIETVQELPDTPVEEEESDVPDVQ